MVVVVPVEALVVGCVPVDVVCAVEVVWAVLVCDVCADVLAVVACVVALVDAVPPLVGWAAAAEDVSWATTEVATTSSRPAKPTEGRISRLSERRLEESWYSGGTKGAI